MCMAFVPARTKPQADIQDPRRAAQMASDTDEFMCLESISEPDNMDMDDDDEAQG